MGNKFQNLEVLETNELSYRDFLFISSMAVERWELRKLPVYLKGVTSSGIMGASWS